MVFIFMHCTQKFTVDIGSQQYINYNAVIHLTVGNVKEQDIYDNVDRYNFTLYLVHKPYLQTFKIKAVYLSEVNIVITCKA
jgi:hypothetical protein